MHILREQTLLTALTAPLQATKWPLSLVDGVLALKVLKVTTMNIGKPKLCTIAKILLSYPPRTK